jgi:hypothetical protein
MENYCTTSKGGTSRNNVPPPRVVPVANNVHRLRTKEQLCDYLHRVAGHPVRKTWLAAIKAGEYATWPGLTYELVSIELLARHLPKLGLNQSRA